VVTELAPEGDRPGSSPRFGPGGLSRDSRRHCANRLCHAPGVSCPGTFLQLDPRRPDSDQPATSLASGSRSTCANGLPGRNNAQVEEIRPAALIRLPRAARYAFRWLLGRRSRRRRQFQLECHVPDNALPSWRMPKQPIHHMGPEQIARSSCRQRIPAAVRVIRTAKPRASGARAWSL